MSQTSTTTIPNDFGAGGSGLAPKGAQGTPSLVDILQELQAAANAAVAAALLTAWDKAADGAANTATAEKVIYRAHRAETITAILLALDSALTADNTNNATITIRRRSSSGGSAVTVATFTTNVAGGNFVAFAPKSLGAISNAALAAGEVLTVEITKGGTGVQIPSGRLFVNGEPTLRTPRAEALPRSQPAAIFAAVIFWSHHMSKIVRIKPYDVRRGQTRRTHSVRGMMFREEGGWYEVNDRTAAYLATVRVSENDPASKLVFDVADSREHAAEIEAAYKAEIAREEARRTGRALRASAVTPATPANTAPRATAHPILDAPDDEPMPVRGPKPTPAAADFAPGSDEGEEVDLNEPPAGAPQAARDGDGEAKPLGDLKERPLSRAERRAARREGK